jgi:hypothetical protein
MKTKDRTSAFEAYLDRCLPVFEGRAPVSSLQVRPCGDCNFCCIAPAIDASQLESHELPVLKPKAAGEKCRHCTSKGCGVYEQRPEICNGYLCLYAIGLNDRKPMEGKVCWTLQPCMQTGTTLVVGHCNDAEEVMMDVDNRKDIREFMAIEGFQKPSAVVLRSPNEVVRFDNSGWHRDLMVDVDQTDPMKMKVIESTQRRAKWRI